MAGAKAFFDINDQGQTGKPRPAAPHQSKDPIVIENLRLVQQLARSRQPANIIPDQPQSFCR